MAGGGIREHKTLVAFSLIVLLAAVLSFWGITSIGLWPPDAGNYVRTSTWLLGIGGVPMDWEPPLFPIAIALAFVLFGAFDFVAAGVPAFFGVLSVIMVYFLGREIFDKKTGLAAALFLAVTEYHIVHSRLVAADTMLTFFFLLSLLFFIRAFRNRSLKYYFLFGLSASLALVTKYLAANILIIVLIFMVSYHAYNLLGRKFSKKHPDRLHAMQAALPSKQSAGNARSHLFFDLKGILIVLALVLILQAGWIFLTGVGRYMSPDRTAHFSMSDVDFQWALANWPTIFSYGIEEYVYVFNHNIVSGFMLESDPMTYVNGLLLWVSPLILLLFIPGCWRLLKERGSMDMLLLIWFFWIFIFFNFMMTIKGVRFILPLLPVLCIAAARGLDLIRPRRIFIIILIATVASGIYGSANSIQAYHNGYRQAGAFINENIGEDDLIFYAGMPQLLFYHEIDTGDWWELGDMDSIDNITYVILTSSNSEGGPFRREEFRRDFRPVAVFTNEVAERELIDMSREMPEYYQIEIFRANESIRGYFNY